MVSNQTGDETMNETFEFEYQETTVRPVFGGKKIEAVYVMTHTEFIGDMETESNDETLTEEAAAELFEEHA
jgi:hypothetical protein